MSRQMYTCAMTSSLATIDNFAGRTCSTITLTTTFVLTTSRPATTTIDTTSTAILLIQLLLLLLQLPLLLLLSPKKKCFISSPHSIPPPFITEPKTWKADCILPFAAFTYGVTFKYISH